MAGRTADFSNLVGVAWVPNEVWEPDVGLGGTVTVEGEKNAAGTLVRRNRSTGHHAESNGALHGRDWCSERPSGRLRCSRRSPNRRPPLPPAPPFGDGAHYGRQRVSRSLAGLMKTREVRLQSLSRRTSRTLRTALNQLFQLLDELCYALEWTTLVIRHPNPLKALSAPRVS